MKFTSEIRVPTTATGAPAVNAEGNPTGNMEQVYALEAADVGMRLDDYTGFGAGCRTITAADVGREVITSFNTAANWMCWRFA